jgi:hypothetical protein
MAEPQVARTVDFTNPAGAKPHEDLLWSEFHARNLRVTLPIVLLAHSD